MLDDIGRTEHNLSTSRLQDPDVASGLTITGIFSYYSVWCFIGFWLVVFFVPETKQIELEAIGAVFDRPLLAICRRNWRSFKTSPSRLRQYFLRNIAKRRSRREGSPASTPGSRSEQQDYELLSYPIDEFRTHIHPGLKDTRRQAPQQTT